MANNTADEDSYINFFFEKFTENALLDNKYNCLPIPSSQTKFSVTQT